MITNIVTKIASSKFGTVVVAHLKASKDLTGLGDVLVLEAHQHIGGRAAPIQHGPFEGFQQGEVKIAADSCRISMENLRGDHVLLDLEPRGAQWIHGGVPCRGWIPMSCVWCCWKAQASRIQVL